MYFVHIIEISFFLNIFSYFFRYHIILKSHIFANIVFVATLELKFNSTRELLIKSAKFGSGKCKNQTSM